MSSCNISIKGLKQYIERGKIEDDYEFSRSSENYIKEYDIVTLKANDEIKLKITYFNKCIGQKKGFHIVEYNDNKIIDDMVFDMYIGDGSVEIKLMNAQILIISCVSETHHTRLCQNLDNVIIEYGNDVNEADAIDTTLYEKLNINDKEYISKINYEYINSKRLHIFEEDEVENYYEYCCNEQGD